MGVKVTEKDRGWRKVRKLTRKNRQKPAATVGFQGQSGNAAHRGGEFSVVDIATVHEFGAEGIPERAPLRVTFDSKQGEYKRILKRLGAQIMSLQMDEKRALDLLGLKAAGDVKERIAAKLPPPNSPVTIARKGSSTPLIDTGQLRGAIHHVVGTGHGRIRRKIG